MIEKTAIVETTQIGENVSIGNFAIIKSGVILGNNVTIHPNVIIETGVTIGNNVEIFPGAYLGKRPKNSGALTREPEYEKERIIIGENCSIGPNAIIYYDVFIGKNTLIGDNVSIRERVTIGEFCVIGRGVTISYNSHIGNRTKIMDLTHITGNCEIGEDVFISTLVATTNDNTFGKGGHGKEHIKGPKIGNGAAIGANASLLPGVVIGDNAIVASSAVVTKDVPSRALVMGIPAQIVRFINDEGNR
ncbi:MAG: transferase [Candidatus Aenigmarchaeota archaeon]|nr:transferase [Candidatus Aenigmarchaeota archaeon]